MTAGFRWPPEMAIVAVIMTDSTIAWAVAMPKTPYWRRDSTWLATEPTPMNTSAKVPRASASERRSSEDISDPSVR